MMKRLCIAACMFSLALVGCGKPAANNDELPDEEGFAYEVEGDPDDDETPDDSAEPKRPVEASEPQNTPPEHVPAESSKVKTASEIEDEIAAQNNLELITSLGDAQLASAASDELVNRGAETVPAIISALDNTNPAIVAQAIFTLGRFGNGAAAALPKLKSLAAESQSETVRDAAQFAIDAIEEAKPAILQ